MHISEGVLPGAVLAAGAALSAAGLAMGLKKLDQERLPQVAILAAAFFVASLVNVPLGPARAHLVLNGLLGLLLGWAAFPAIFVALTLQAVLFAFGGLTTLGVTTFNLALPALVCHWLFAPLVRRGGRRLPLLAGFAAGFLGVGLAAVMVALCLATAGEEMFTAARLVLLAHLPVMVVEGLVTAAAVVFLARVRPALLA
ncbi:MAG: cobalt transporter CbiM [Thermodesulfobacteriota bacterium]